MQIQQNLSDVPCFTVEKIVRGRVQLPSGVFKIFAALRRVILTRLLECEEYSYI